MIAIPCSPHTRSAVSRAARRAPFAGFAALLAASLLSSCSHGPGKGGFSMPPVPVEVSDVTPQVVREQFHALGSIDADESVEIVSEVNGMVVRLPFVEGGPIARGALLAHLDDREAAADAARAQARHTLAAANAERAEKLFETQAISHSALDDARANLQVAEADDASASARLAKTRIRAPFSGVVGRRRVSPGAYLRAGDVITEVAKLDVMKVRFVAPEREMPHLGRGHAVEVTTPAVPGQTFPGEITVVDPIVDPNSRTVHIVARVRNPHRLLKSGMSGNVAVTLAEHPRALVVPDEAVFAQGSQAMVFVVNPDSTVTGMPVELGIRDSSRVEIVSGLTAGARVVRAGHQKLFPGAHVMPMPSGGDAAVAPGADAKPANAKPATPASSASKSATTSTPAKGGGTK